MGVIKTGKTPQKRKKKGVLGTLAEQGKYLVRGKTGSSGKAVGRGVRSGASVGAVKGFAGKSRKKKR